MRRNQAGSNGAVNVAPAATRDGALDLMNR
jgi:hypothetical protein